MAGSKHQNWLFIVDGKQRIFRKLNDGFDVLEYERYTYTEEHTEAVCNLIRDNLTENLLGADFIKKYPKTHKRWNDPYFGYCVPATFALLYLMDTDKLEPITSKDKEGIDHWWLRDKDHPNKIYDITHEQYADKTVLKQLYETGKVSGYYGGYSPNYEMPASRFLTLMDKVQETAVRWKATYKDEPLPATLEEFL